MSRVFYNEIDPQKSEWLRQLMKRGIIAQGIVDERSIKEIDPNELLGFTQCHFFAGIGIWSYALRLAGWSDDRTVWTGSCPCQPFSVAGQGKGEMDERHLWPAWFRLLSECRPVVVFGEQVADGDGISWLDNVQTNLEAEDYRFGACVLPAAGFGAPHGRHRIVFVADTRYGAGRRGNAGISRSESQNRPEDNGSTRHGGEIGELADTIGTNEQQREKTIRQAQSARRGLHGKLGHSESGNGSIPIRQEREETSESGRTGAIVGVALGNTDKAGSQGRGLPRSLEQRESGNGCVARPTGPVNGFWANAEWIPCRGKVPGTIDWRPIKPGTFPLAHGATSRILRLRGYGDGIVAPAATEFIKAYSQIQEDAIRLSLESKT